MKLLPRTLFGQLLLALFAGLVALQSVGFWLMLDERVRFGERLLGIYAAQRIAGVISIFDKAGPAERARLLHALNVPPLHVSLSEQWHDAPQENSEDARLFVDRVARELETPAPLQVLSIKRAEGRHHDGPAGAPAQAHVPGPGASGDIWAGRREHRGPPILFVTGQARLSDGVVITFRHSLPQQGMDWPLRLFALLAVLGIAVALLAAWAVRRLTRPLAALADAATGLACNLERAPLPESGPLEVSRAAQAFNAMQRDLRRYLDTRAQALAAVSHDLRMPITRLRLRLERIADRELQVKMESDLAEMDGMIGHTLEFLRAGSSTEKTQKLDVNALLESVIGDMSMLGAHIELHGTATTPIVAKPQAVRRCLVNLLDNAWRYGGGAIDVCVNDSDAEVEIAIQDRGPGIPADELERVFEPYVRLESSRAKHTGGTGLGLAITRAIARMHGGDVRLMARPGGGTCALLRLPRHPR
ncbi:MAG TPA: ATP-binding protein [Noviherbaspirillum sp.]|nr:ATP-binding protein [Noviherbaspirillum sp.]